MSTPVIGLGFRVSPQEIEYAVVRLLDGKFSVVTVETITVPRSMDAPHQLKHMRTTVTALIKERGAKCVGIKTAENGMHKPKPIRLYIEGVIQEAAASNAVTGYFCGAIPTLNALFEFRDKKAMKRMLEDEEQFPLVELSQFSRDQRDAIVAAIGAIKNHGN